MAELPGDPRCNFCGHLASSHRYQAAPDLSVLCTACQGGRCDPARPRHVKLVTALTAERADEADAQFAGDLDRAVRAERERAAIAAPESDLTRDMNDMRDWGANDGA